jgi:hypothetical protein
MQKRINEAKANKMSVLSALVEKQKPVYDEKKEKRMRNRAMIQAFGDVLSEASKGYFAYNKKGAGVVPKSTPSNALEEVNKISEMQKKYLNDKKTWDNLNFEWQQKKSQADIDAAEALLIKEEKYQEKLEKRIDELRKRGVEITDKIIDQEIDKLIKIEDEERDNQNTIALHEEMKQKKLGQYAPSKARSGGGGGSYAKQVAAQKKAADNEKIKMWGIVHDVNPEDMLDIEKEHALNEYDNDISVAVFNILLNEGVSRDEALSLIGNIGNDDRLLEYYTEWVNSEEDMSMYELIKDLSDDMDYIKSLYGL